MNVVNIERCQVINHAAPAVPAAPAQTPAESAAGGSARELSETDLTSPFFTARHEELSVDQENAMETLRRGGTIAEAARAADVSRMTVYRWVKADPHFRAIYRQWQDEVRHSARARLMSLTYKAVTTVQNSIEAGDAKLALQMLKHLGALLPEETWQMELAMTDPKLVSRIDAVHEKQIADAVRKEEDRLTAPRQKKRGKNSPTNTH